MWSFIPASWRIGLAIAGTLAVVGGLGATYVYVRHQGYSQGFAEARTVCAAEQAEQAEANRAAVRDAEQRLYELADQLSLKELELDDALADIDAAVAADPDGDLLCLDADSLQRLNAIR